VGNVTCARYEKGKFRRPRFVLYYNYYIILSFLSQHVHRSTTTSPLPLPLTHLSSLPKLRRLQLHLYTPPRRCRRFRHVQHTPTHQKSLQSIRGRHASHVLRPRLNRARRSHPGVCRCGNIGRGRQEHNAVTRSREADKEFKVRVGGKRPRRGEAERRGWTLAGGGDAETVGWRAAAEFYDVAGPGTGCDEQAAGGEGGGAAGCGGSGGCFRFGGKGFGDGCLDLGDDDAGDGDGDDGAGG